MGEARCLECSHEFPEDVAVVLDTGFVGCPRCKSANIEVIITAYDYDKTKVSYKEGKGHD